MNKFQSIKLKSFDCKEPPKYNDSMLYDSGTCLATATYEIHGCPCTMSLEVRGEVAVNYKGEIYNAPSEFPEELRARIERDPYWWNACAPSGEGNDAPESDLNVDLNNWFEIIWVYESQSDGVFFEENSCSMEDILRGFEGVAQMIAAMPVN